MTTTTDDLQPGTLSEGVVRDVAERAGLTLDAQQLATATAELRHVLSWAQALPEVDPVHIPQLTPRRRADEPQAVDPAPILDEAAQHDGAAIVVPPVLDQT